MFSDFYGRGSVHRPRQAWRGSRPGCQEGGGRTPQVPVHGLSVSPSRPQAPLRHRPQGFCVAQIGHGWWTGPFIDCLPGKGTRSHGPGNGPAWHTANTKEASDRSCGHLLGCGNGGVQVLEGGGQCVGGTAMLCRSSAGLSGNQRGSPSLEGSLSLGVEEGETSSGSGVATRGSSSPGSLPVSGVDSSKAGCALAFVEGGGGWG